MDNNNNFQSSLRVLAVDDNIVCLEMLVVGLQQCGYEVTAKTGALEALAILKENKDYFDIVVTDVTMPDIDGFKLLELIRLETDIPVIMISTNIDPQTVVKGVKHGAQDYLAKPVKVEDLRKLWEYATKKPEYDHTPSSIETRETVVQSLSPEDYKERDMEKEDEISRSDQITSSRKKHTKKRITWTRQLHKKFLDAIQQLQVDLHSKIIPTKILEIMDEPDLTRENVGSHLQKYRKMLAKQRKTLGQDIIDTNRTMEHLPDADFTASTIIPGRPIITRSNSGGGYGISNAGQMNPISRYLMKTGMSDSFSANTKPLNNNDLQFQHNLLHSQVMNQMQPAMPSSLLGNDYMANSTQIRCFMPGYRYLNSSFPPPTSGNLGQHHSHPVLGIAPYSQSPGAFCNVYSPYQISKGFLNQVLNSQPDLLLEQVGCPLPGNFSGHFDAANMTNFGDEAKSEMNECLGNMQIFSNELIGENFSSDNQHDFFKQDDDLSAILNEFRTPSVPPL
ncbi:two-component response regulator ARR18-like [Olea europaea subsp. europaea]|uniref:Two-component response regulator ARR18-like n=1 Tax=Olea europaea subsp. europaea TaxID=158383 RepID=A0A8S0VNA2_OLEEU|nr:two-component response regulator ARR18-like [Olea europaea subsp. europaea]